MKRNYLGNRQNSIINFIKKYIAKNGHSPSIREIASGVNLSSPATVHVHIKNLIDMGYLRRDDKNELELMVPNEFEYRESDAIQVPFIHQYTIFDFDDIMNDPIDTFYLSVQMIPSGSEVFVVLALDNNYKSFNIFKNDYIIVDRIDKFSYKDLVVFLNNESKICIDKYVNINNDYHILGKVIGLYREI